MGLGSLVSDIFGGGGSEVNVSALSPEERQLLDQLQNIAVGDQELYGLYKSYLTEALTGEIPQVESDIARSRSVLEEDIRRRLGSFGDIATNIGASRLSEFERDVAAPVREQARGSRVALGGSLLSQYTGQRIGAAGTALGIYGQQRGYELQASTFNAQQQQGGGLASMFGGAISGAAIAGLTGGTSLLAGAGLGAIGAGGIIPFAGGGGGESTYDFGKSSLETYQPASPTYQPTLNLDYGRF